MHTRYTESTHTERVSAFIPDTPRRTVPKAETIPWYGEPHILGNYRSANEQSGYQVIGGNRYRMHFNTEKEAERELARRQSNPHN